MVNEQVRRKKDWKERDRAQSVGTRRVVQRNLSLAQSQTRPAIWSSLISHACFLATSNDGPDLG